MKKKPRRRISAPKPPPIDPLAAQLAEFTKLVMLGASLYHSGMKQGTPSPGAVAPPNFTFSDQIKPEPNNDKKPVRLPDV